MTRLHISFFTLLILVLGAGGLGYLHGFKVAQNRQLHPATMAKSHSAKSKTYKPNPIINELIGKKPGDKAIELEPTELMPEGPSPESMEFEQLTTELFTKMADSKALTKDDLQRNLLLADQLIKKDPELYGAYKAKIVSLLLLEVKHQQPIEMADYEALMEEMMDFSGLNTEDEILSQIRDNLDQEVLPSEELDEIDHELLHLPFIRFAALKDMESLATISNEYIEEFPDSYIGYLYLAEAHWKQGEEAQAIEILSEKMQQDGNEDIVRQFLEHTKKDPLLRIEQFRVY